MEKDHYFLIIFTLGSFFPVSALVYILFQRKKRIQRLTDDFNLLGIPMSNLCQLGKEGLWESIKIFSNFFAHSLLTAIIVILGAYLLCEFPDAAGENKFSIGPFLEYGFLGAYVFSLQLVYRRYTTLDLQPTVYMNCTVTLVSGLAFNYTAFQAITNLSSSHPAPGGLGTGIFAIIAFSLGYFPLLAIRWFNRLSNTALGDKLHKKDALPLSIVDGISRLHETRLRDEGIDNVQNLAAVRIDELLMSTRFNAQQVIEWIDQAILYLYVDKARVDSFHHSSVRTISDFKELWKPYYANPEILIENHKINQINEEMTEARQKTALRIQSTPEYLDSLYTSVLMGPNIAYIENFWINQKNLIQAQQNQNLKDDLGKIKSVVESVIIDIFKIISEVQYFEKEYRENLGNLAIALDPTFKKANYDLDNLENNHRALAGCAWFADWLTREKNADLDHSKKEFFTTLATNYYDKAFDNLSENPKLIYEITIFFVNKEDINTAKKYASKPIIDDQESDFTKSLFTIVLAWVQYKDHKSEEADTSADNAVEIIKNSQGIDRYDLNYLEKIVEDMKKAFSEDHIPPSFENLAESIDEQLHHSPSPRTDSPPPEKVDRKK